MRQVQGWHEITEDGTKREFEVSRNRNEWTFRYRDHRRDDWTEVRNPTVGMWEQLLDLMERKYQRRRCAWRDVEQVKDYLEKRKRRG